MATATATAMAMQRRGDRAAGRPARWWLKLFIVAVGTIVVAAMAAIDALANIAAGDRPALVLAITPHNALAASAAADASVMANNGAVRPADLALARIALRTDPLDPAMIRLVATDALARHDTKGGVALLRLASRVSRRDPASQLMLIEQSVADGDVDTALTHYDQAMRVRPELRETLLPILANAIGDPLINGRLAVLLRSDPPWRYAFFYQAVREADSVATVNLIARMGHWPTTDQYRALHQQLVDRLVMNRAFPTARSVYRSIPGADDRRWVSTAYAGGDVDSTDPAGWRLTNSPDFTVELVSLETNALTLHVAMPSGHGAMVAYKTLMLPPGRWRASLPGSVTPSGDGALSWALYCPGAAKDLDSWPKLADVVDNRDMVIDASCPAQLLRLVVNGGGQGFDGNLAAPMLRPAGRGSGG